jgi:hypothetical protein
LSVSDAVARLYHPARSIAEALSGLEAISPRTNILSRVTDGADGTIPANPSFQNN